MNPYTWTALILASLIIGLIVAELRSLNNTGQEIDEDEEGND